MRKKFTRSRKSNKTITTGKQGTGISSNLSLWRHFLWKQRHSPIVIQIGEISLEEAFHWPESKMTLSSRHARPVTETILALRQESFGDKHTDSTVE